MKRVSVIISFFLLALYSHGGHAIAADTQGSHHDAACEISHAKARYLRS